MTDTYTLTLTGEELRFLASAAQEYDAYERDAPDGLLEKLDVITPPEPPPVLADPPNVFVYGILMRDASVAAALPDHELAFGRFATVEDAPGGTVFGGLVTDVSEARLRGYDGVEGCRQGDPEHSYYQRKVVQVQVGNELVDAWVYQMTDAYPERHAPRTELVTSMRQQYARLGHEANATAKLAAAEEAGRMVVGGPAE